MKLPKPLAEMNEQGQALIVILLAMSVALTLVLASVSRSVTDVEITDREEESLRAFSAAEAGVEEALLELTQTGSFVSKSDTFSGQQTTTEYTVNTIQERAGEYYEHPNILGPGDTATFWLVGHSNDGKLDCSGNQCVRTNNVKICFGDEGISYTKKPAVEVQVFYDDSGDPPLAVSSDDFSNVKVRTFAFDTESSRTSDNNFEDAKSNCNIDPIKSRYKYRTENLTNTDLPNCSNSSSCLLAIKVKSLYTNQNLPVALSVAGDQAILPAQGVVINSTGTSGESTRKLNVEYNFSSIPSIFDNTLFSGGGLTK